MMTRSLPLVLVLLTSAAALPGAWAQAISSFETEEDMQGFSPSGVEAQRVQQYASDGDWALKVDFPGSAKDTWPGLLFTPRLDSTKFRVLSFDVGNPSKQNLHLSWRIDLVEGDPIFSGEGVGAQTTKRLDIWISRMKRIKHILLYARMPRHDFTFYFDNFRWADVGARFTALHYVDDSPEPVPTKQQEDRGFVLFHRPLTDVVFATAVPGEHEQCEALQVFAAPSEYEPATISLYALEDLNQVKVSVEGLPATAEVLPIRTLDKRVTYSSAQYIADMPVLCERRDKVDVPAGTCKRFLIDLQVDDGAAPRVYEGQVHIDAEGRDRVTIPFRLRVIPIKLEDPEGMFWGEYYTGPRLATTDEEKSQVLRRDMIDMRRHGMTSVGLCIGAPIDKLQWNGNDACELGFDGTSLYEQFMDLYVELGYPMPVILLSDTGQAAAGKDSDYAVDSEEWGRRYKAFWRAMQVLAQERGWPEVIVQPVDEPGWQSRDHKERNVRCLKLLKQIPGMRTEQDGPGDGYFHNEAGPYADVWNYNGAIAKPDQIREYQAAGKTIVLYNCDVESYRPEVDRYVAGWFQAAAGVSGCYNWAYMSFYGSPYDDLDHKTGTWMHEYPPTEDEPGGPSTGWIGAREGIDDYKYIDALRRTIARARANPDAQTQKAADQAQAALQDILATIDYSPRVRSAARWTKTGTSPEGAKTIGGTLKLPNGWQHAEYEKARWSVARATLDVMAALGELPSSVKGATAQSNNGPLVSKLHWHTQPPPKPVQIGGQNARQATIPVLQQTPAVDGDLADPIWSKAAKLEPFALSSGLGKPQMQTDVLMLCDGVNLCLGVTCHEDKMGYITAAVSQEGGPVWQDDCVEVFVDNNFDRSTFKQVLVNSLGTQGWNNSADSKWRAASKAATQLYEDRWTVELMIPMADLGLTGPQFGFNVCRERRPTETMELSCWSPTGGAFGMPDKFGLASLGQAWVGALDAPPASIGNNAFTVTIKNETDRPRRLDTVALVQWPDREASQVLPGPPTAKDMTLAPGAREQLTYEYGLSGEQAPILTLSVRDAADGEVLAQRVFSPPLLRPMAAQIRPRTYYLSENVGTAELQINLAPDRWADCRLIVALYDAEQKTILRQFDIAPIEGNRLNATLNLRGVAEGSYTLWVLLDDGRGQRIAEKCGRLVRLSGPFD